MRSTVLKPAVILGVIAGVMVLALVAYWWSQRSDEAVSLHQLGIRYSFEIINQTGELIEDAEFIFFAPAHIPGRQELISLRTNQPTEVIEDRFGNRSLRLGISALAPFATRILIVDAELMAYAPPIAQALASNTKNEFLLSEPNVQVEHPLIQAQAEALKAQLATGADQRIVGLSRWVSKHVTDVGYISEDRGAVYALTQRQGDCTEYMSLYAALSRALGIPTRNLAGFRIAGESARLNPHAYHNWSESHNGRRWVLVDPQHELVDEYYAEYVIFRVLTSQTQLSNTQRFFSADPRLGIRMQ